MLHFSRIDRASILGDNPERVSDIKIYPEFPIAQVTLSESEKGCNYISFHILFGVERYEH